MDQGLNTVPSADYNSDVDYNAKTAANAAMSRLDYLIQAIVLIQTFPLIIADT